MMYPDRTFGRTGLTVSALALGTSSWGVARADESPDDASRRIQLLADEFFSGRLPATVIDTSNEYGASTSESLIGAAITRAGGIPPSLVLQTKLDRDTGTGEFTGDRMWRSLEESQSRLGIDRFAVLYLHDPEHIGFAESMTPGGPVEALVAMRERGLADHIGVAGGPVGLLQQFVETDIFEALVTHNRYTLIDRSAGSLLDAAGSRGMGICNAAPFGGGILTGDPRFGASYGYRPTSPEIARAVERMTALCAEAGVTLGAAAVQFSLREPRIHTTIVGASSLSSAERSTGDASAPIPEWLWDELDRAAPSGVALDAG